MEGSQWVDDYKGKSVRITLSVAPEDIIYINSVLDSYDGIALIRTMDRATDNCVILTTDTVYKDTLKVIDEIKKDGATIYDVKVERSEKIDF